AALPRCQAERRERASPAGVSFTGLSNPSRVIRAIPGPRPERNRTRMCLRCSAVLAQPHVTRERVGAPTGPQARLRSRGRAHPGGRSVDKRLVSAALSLSTIALSLGLVCYGIRFGCGVRE